MKKASFIATISMLILIIVKLYIIIENYYYYGLVIIPRVFIFEILNLVAYCGIGYFFLKLYKQQR